MWCVWKGILDFKFVKYSSQDSFWWETAPVSYLREKIHSFVKSLLPSNDSRQGSPITYTMKVVSSEFLFDLLDIFISNPNLLGAIYYVSTRLIMSLLYRKNRTNARCAINRSRRQEIWNHICMSTTAVGHSSAMYASEDSASRPICGIIFSSIQVNA